MHRGTPRARAISRSLRPECAILVGVDRAIWQARCTGRPWSSVKIVQRLASQTALQFSGQHILDRGELQSLVRIHALEAGILPIELLQALQFGHAYATELILPQVECRPTDLVLSELVATVALASASRKIPTIWVSVNFDFRINCSGEGHRSLAFNCAIGGGLRLQ